MNNECSLDLKKSYYVYLYLDPRFPGCYEYVTPAGKFLRLKHKPMYVGKGKNKRIDAHMIEAEGEKDSYKLNLIRKIKELGLDPIRIPTASRVDAAMAYAFEIDLIAGIGRYGKHLNAGVLTNCNDGGPGNSGYEFTTKDKAVISKVQHERFKSQIERDKISVALKGRTRNRESVEKMIITNTGRKRSPEFCKLMSVTQKGKKQTSESVANSKLGFRNWFDSLTKEERRLVSQNATAARASSPDKTCSVCGYTGRPNVISRRHETKCTYKRL